MAQSEDQAGQPPAELVISRVFEAPRDAVWRAWTEAERLPHWWGPKGFALKVARLDLRPGGMFHYSMRSANGHEMWGKFVYREIAAPERLVFVSGFSDPEGNSTRGPFSETWPLAILNVLTLTETDGCTTLTLRGGPVDPTPAERDTFVGMLESMRGGFGSTFDQLVAYLAGER